MATERHLGQLRPANTTPASIFSPDVATGYKIKLVSICNVGTVTANAFLYHDPTGTTYDETTALIFNHPLKPGESICYKGKITDYRVAGNLAGKTSVANVLNFKAYGKVKGELL